MKVSDYKHIGSPSENDHKEAISQRASNGTKKNLNRFGRSRPRSEKSEDDKCYVLGYN